MASDMQRINALGLEPAAPRVRPKGFLMQSSAKSGTGDLKADFKAFAEQLRKGDLKAASGKSKDDDVTAKNTLDSASTSSPFCSTPAPTQSLHDILDALLTSKLTSDHRRSPEWPDAKGQSYREVLGAPQMQQSQQMQMQQMQMQQQWMEQMQQQQMQQSQQQNPKRRQGGADQSANWRAQQGQAEQQNQQQQPSPGPQMMMPQNFAQFANQQQMNPAQWPGAAQQNPQWNQQMQMPQGQQVMFNQQQMQGMQGMQFAMANPNMMQGMMPGGMPAGYAFTPQAGGMPAGPWNGQAATQ